MTREEAINILIAVAVCSTEYLYCDEHCPFYHPDGVRVCNEWNDEMAKEAVETISALRQQDVADKDVRNNEPLTLDELRKMDGEPVWCEIYIKGQSPFYGIVHGENVTGFIRGDDKPANLAITNVGAYGLAWMAFLQKPEEGTV